MRYGQLNNTPRSTTKRGSGASIFSLINTAFVLRWLQSTNYLRLLPILIISLVLPWLSLGSNHILTIKSAQAATDRKIPFSARIKNASTGLPLATGSQSFAFKLYTAETGGTAIWSESQILTISSGTVSTFLGLGTALPADLNFDATDPYYLGVTVGSDAEMSPRKRVGSVPSAFNADTVDGAHAGTGANNVLKLDSSGNIAIQGGATLGGNLVFGTVTSGAWNGTAVGTTYGGTGQSSYTVGDTLYASSATAVSKLAIGSNGQCLTVSSSLPSWGSCSGSSTTLQVAYDNGGTITTANSKDIDIVLADTTTDSNLDIQIATNSTSTVSITRPAGSGTSNPAQLLLVEDLDADLTIADGIIVQSAGVLTDALELSDAEIVNALNIGANTILGTTATLDFTNFDVTSAGVLTAASTINGATLSGGTLSGGSLSATAVNGLSVASGTISVGTWNGTAIGPTYGGTGQSTITTGDLLYGSATNVWSKLAAGTDGQCLIQSSGIPSWTACTSGTGVGDITAVGSMTSGAAFADSGADDDWLGLGSAAGRIEFDDQTTDEVNIIGALLGVGTSTPSYKLDVQTGASGYVANFAGAADRFFIYDNAPTDYQIGTGGAVGLSLDTSAAQRLTVDASNYFVGIGTTAPASMLELDRSLTTTSWTTSGIQLQAAAGTFTDSTGSGTIAARVANSFAQATFAASSSVTVTDAATAYIADAPAAGTNTTLTSAWALWVDAGNVRFDGTVVTTSQAALRFDPYGTSAGNTGEARWLELAANGTNYAGLKAPDSIAANIIWTLPSADGAANTFLQTSGSGALTWASGYADIQTFTASGTWTKPSGITVVRVECVGAGGGGGGGRGAPTNEVRAGGSGGGGGAFTSETFLATDLGSTETVTVGAGGTAGAAGSSGNGGDGGAGSTTTFGSDLTCFGGGAGLGGLVANASGGGGAGTAGAGSLGGAGTSSTGGSPTTAANTAGIGGGGAGGIGSAVGKAAEYGGAAGGAANITVGAFDAGQSMFGSGGGGAGGSLTAANAALAPSAGGGVEGFSSGGGGAAGTSGGTCTGGTAGTAGTTERGGTGGGGGGSDTDTAGCAGAAGGAPGGGGGGGGGGATTGGAGAVGGRGEVRVYSW